MPQLPPTHYETSKHESPTETKIKEKQNETISDSNSNLFQVNDSSQSNQGTDTWFLNLPVDESIDNKNTKFEVQIQDPMKHN
jgi:hypothetical protein